MKRFEAIPVDDVIDLLALRIDESATDVTRRLGMAFSDCAGLMEAFAGRSASDMARTRLQETCAAARNHGQLLEAGRLLAHAGEFDGCHRASWPGGGTGSQFDQRTDFVAGLASTVRAL